MSGDPWRGTSSLTFGQQGGEEDQEGGAAAGHRRPHRARQAALLTPWPAGGRITGAATAGTGAPLLAVGRRAAAIDRSPRGELGRPRTS